MTHDEEEGEDIDISVGQPADIEINLSDQDADEEVVEEENLLTRISLSGTVDTEIDATGDTELSGRGDNDTDPEDEIDSRKDISTKTPSARGAKTNAYPRGSFVFPENDHALMQRLEIRGNNGAQRDVETVYLLAGDSYWTPSELIALDDPALYTHMDGSSVSMKLNRILDHFERLYAHRESPKLIGYVHTHPNGSTRPSQIDREGSKTTKAMFEDRFDDFEFFNIIHALGDNVDVPADKLRRPKASDGGVWWYGETRRHELAIFDESYNSRRVILDGF